MKAWVSKKVAPCARSDKPDLLYPNYDLCEFWFTHEMGQDLAATTELGEVVERAATDLAAAVGSLCMDDVPSCRRHGSQECKHKQLVNKVSSSAQKLAKVLAAADSKLPLWRRQLPTPAFNRFKAGVAKCRDARESVLDELEDLKLFVVDKSPSDHAVDSSRLSELATTLSEHMSALQDAIKSNEPGSSDEIKSEAPDPSLAPATEEEQEPMD